MGWVQQRSLGISISGERVAFAEVGKVLGWVRLLRSGTFTLPEGEDHPEPELQAERHGGLRQGLKTTGEVIVGIPRRSLVLRFLELPDLEEADLAGLLAYELERHLPFAPEEACHSFQKLTRKAGKAEVLFVAASRAEVEGAIGQAGRLGLRPTAVDVAAVAATNAFLFRQRGRRGEVRSLVAVDGGEASVSVMRDGALLSSRAVPLSDSSLVPLLEEIKRISETVPEGPGRMFVSGGSEGLWLRLKEELGVPVERWSVAESSVDASAFGLALRGLVKLPTRINLLPVERRRKKRERAVLVMFALLALVGVLGSALGLSSAYRERRVLAELDRQVGAVRAESAEVATLKDTFASLRARRELLEGIAAEQGRPLLVLKELIGLLPPDVLLTELSLEEDRVRIRGSTTSSASELISAFERSSVFENAAFTSPISAQGNDRQRFQIEAFVKDRPSAVQRRSPLGGRR